MIVVLAAALVVLAGLFSAADAALTSFSRARAEELQAEGQAGSKRLVTMLADPAPYLNTAILLRLLCEVSFPEWRRIKRVEELRDRAQFHFDSSCVRRVARSGCHMGTRSRLPVAVRSPPGRSG